MDTVFFFIIDEVVRLGEDLIEEGLVFDEEILLQEKDIFSFAFIQEIIDGIVSPILTGSHYIDEVSKRKFSPDEIREVYFPMMFAKSNPDRREIVFESLEIISTHWIINVARPNEQGSWLFHNPINSL